MEKKVQVTLAVVQAHAASLLVRVTAAGVGCGPPKLKIVVHCVVYLIAYSSLLHLYVVINFRFCCLYFCPK